MSDGLKAQNKFRNPQENSSYQLTESHLPQQTLLSQEVFYGGADRLYSIQQSITGDEANSNSENKNGAQ